MSSQAVLQESGKTGIFASSSFSGAVGRSLSYFHQSDLEVTVGRLGHLDEERRLVGVVFDDVVVHVDKNPARTEREGYRGRRTHKETHIHLHNYNVQIV